MQNPKHMEQDSEGQWLIETIFSEAVLKPIKKELEGAATPTTKSEAIKSGSYFVNARWLGGMLTNFSTIRKRINRLEQLKAMESDGTFELLPKKEVIKLRLEIEKLEKFLGGVKDMKELPGALFIVDPKKERIAVAEAKKLDIPIVAIVDTNCDPDMVDYVIPGNDDAIRAVKLICSAISQSIIENKDGSILEENIEEFVQEDTTEEIFEEKIEE